MNTLELACEPLFEIDNTELKEKAKKKRNWENGFQKWSDEQAQDGTTPTGVCGYSDICDYCTDNTYGRPCVRALNAYLRKTGKSIDYDNDAFEEWW